MWWLESIPNGGPQNIHKWFNTTAFVAPAFGTFGNEGVSTIIGPKLVEFDIALARSFRLSERKSLQFRAESVRICSIIRTSARRT